MPRQGNLLEAIARQWDEQESAALRASSPALLVVRYEDLAQDGCAVLRTCLDHLDLSWSNDVEKFLETGMGGLHTSSVGRWRTELADEQFEAVEHLLAPTLTAAGYEVR